MNFFLFLPGLVFAIATAAIIIIRFCVKTYVVEKKGWHTEHVQKILYGIITGITILVVAIPEGLPLAVTLTLAVSSKVICITVYCHSS